MTNKESSDGSARSRRGSQASTSIHNIQKAISTHESPTCVGSDAWQSILRSDTPPLKQPEDSQLAAEEERAAQRRSEAAKRDRVERQFAELFWPVEWLLLWIAFRDPVRFDDDFLLAMFGANSYGKVPLRDNNPRRTLLRALQSGSLPGIKDGAELPREAWAAAIERRWPADVRFRREDVLNLWPTPGSDAVIEQPHLSIVKLKGEALSQAICKAIKLAIDRQAATGGKNLNGKQQTTDAMAILREWGTPAPRRDVEKIADAKFKEFRNAVGVTFKSQRAKN
jgi:hypothetical protein